MPLNRRQDRLFGSVVDLYPPAAPGVDDEGGALDVSYPPLPKYRGVRCHKIESQELNEAALPGRTNYDISLTIDQFKFAFDQEVEDGWLIKLYPPDGVASDRAKPQFYVTQGGAQDKPSVGRRRANQRKIFAVKTIRVKTIQDGGLLVRAPKW